MGRHSVSEWLGIEPLPAPQLPEQDDLPDRDEGGMDIVEMKARYRFAQKHDQSGKRGDAALGDTCPFEHGTSPDGGGRRRAKPADCADDKPFVRMARV
jgi:hypothetical protein